MKDIVVKGTEGCGECDDCGYYDWGSYEVTYPDGSIVNYDWDNHLGGGSKDQLFPAILRGLGYVVVEDVEWKDTK